MSSCLITGATGFVGGHVTEACSAQGVSVRALARPGSDTSLLKRCAATIIPGDLGDPDAIRQAVEGVDYVVHCAAKVGDWGPVDDYREVNVEGLRRLLDACRAQPLKRFVHLSSLGVYAARHHYGTDESEPLPERHIDGYTQTKVESEKLALDYYRLHKVPVVVLRPGFIYGPRDRTVLPKLVRSLRNGVVRYLGSGDRALNTIYVGNLVYAIQLALDRPGVEGQVFNLTDGEAVSKRLFIEAVADGAGVPRPARKVPLWIARIAAWWMERRARRRGDPQPPRLTQGRLKFLGLNLDFSIAKAKRDLGYAPPMSFAEGMRQTVAWLKQNG
jgi:nucleoside-diphosphate-sugar epimerase